MKKSFKKILILVMAVVCVCSIQITVSAQPSIGNGSLGNIFEDWINGMLTSLNPNNTTAPSTENTTATTENPDNTTATTDPNAQATDPINNSGTGTVASTTEPTVYYPPVTNNPNTVNPVPQITTTEPAGDDEMSFTYDSSLSGLLEADSAAVIVQNPAETQYTLGGIVVNNNNTKNDVFSWQKIALIAAAGLFVVLSALVVALLIQRGKKDDDNKGSGVRTDYEADAPSGPVAVEVMTAERIAELLGSAPGKQRANVDTSNLTSEDSAAAIKTAALMGQLNSYSDPLIRKYTEEPVRFSPLANVGSNGDVTGAEILQATDSMLDDITGNEKYAADTSGLFISTDNFEDLLEDTEIKICPECQSPVTSGDVFCHTCGAYVG